MAHILVVDDEKDIVQLVARFAQHEGHTVTTASGGLEAVALCKERDFDVMVLDIMMPDMDGYAVCREVRKEKDIPIIMLTAMGEEYDKLMGFELGIDDYMVKPFSPKELMARINVIVTRRNGRFDLGKMFSVGSIQVDRLGRNVYIDGKKIDLTTKEYDILMFFMENRGIALSREKILNAVWGYDYYGDGRVVDWQIKLLRAKLGDKRDCIITLRGMGYKFEDKA